LPSAQSQQIRKQLSNARLAVAKSDKAMALEIFVSILRILFGHYGVYFWETLATFFPETLLSVAQTQVSMTYGQAGVLSKSLMSLASAVRDTGETIREVGEKWQRRLQQGEFNQGFAARSTGELYDELRKRAARELQSFFRQANDEI